MKLEHLQPIAATRDIVPDASVSCSFLASAVPSEYLPQIGSAKRKGEIIPELDHLLEDSFLQYDGTGEVPSQIHSCLSTNHKDLHSLDKSNPALVAKAKDRWYVPDPNKAQDLEKKREKALLKEFETYKAFSGRRSRTLGSRCCAPAFVRHGPTRTTR